MANFLKPKTWLTRHLAILFIAVTASFSRSEAQILKSLVPDNAVLQYGGSIGYGSIGGGYDLFKGKGNLDLIYGFVPKSKGGTLHIATAKFAYRPLKINVKKVAAVYPLNPGVFLSYHAGKQFNLTWDEEQYPDGYYWWSPALRTHLSLSSELRLNTRQLFHDPGIKQVGLYYELNTNDLYAASWFQNRKTMSFYDIVKSGFGIRIYF